MRVFSLEMSFLTGFYETSGPGLHPSCFFVAEPILGLATGGMEFGEARGWAGSSGRPLGRGQ